MSIFSSLGRYRDFGLLFARVGLGAMMIVHGYPKLLGGPAGWEQLGQSMQYVGINFLPVFWGFMAAVTEAVGGILLIIGLAFRPACLLLAINMIVAAVTHLAKGDGVSGASHAIELAFVFAGLLFIGPGKYSVDKK